MTCASKRNPQSEYFRNFPHLRLAKPDNLAIQNKRQSEVLDKTIMRGMRVERRKPKREEEKAETNAKRS